MVNQLAVRLGKDLNAGVPFYGRQAGVADVPKIEAPLMFQYAGNDQGVNAGIAAYETSLKENKKKFESFTYEGKQHGFHNDTTPESFQPALQDKDGRDPLHIPQASPPTVEMLVLFKILRRC